MIFTLEDVVSGLVKNGFQFVILDSNPYFYSVLVYGKENQEEHIINSCCEICNNYFCIDDKQENLYIWLKNNR